MGRYGGEIMTNLGFHEATNNAGRIYDHLTGPAGMPLEEYLTLEAIIFNMEMLRDFITEERSPGRRLTDYTHSLGYASAASLLHVPGEPSPPVDEAGFAIVASVLRGYLESQSRLLQAPD